MVFFIFLVGIGSFLVKGNMVCGTLFFEKYWIFFYISYRGMYIILIFGVGFGFKSFEGSVENRRYRLWLTIEEGVFFFFFLETI